MSRIIIVSVRPKHTNRTYLDKRFNLSTTPSCKAPATPTKQVIPMHGISCRAGTSHKGAHCGHQLLHQDILGFHSLEPPSPRASFVAVNSHLGFQSFILKADLMNQNATLPFPLLESITIDGQSTFHKHKKITHGIFATQSKRPSATAASLRRGTIASPSCPRQPL